MSKERHESPKAVNVNVTLAPACLKVRLNGPIGNEATSAIFRVQTKSYLFCAQLAVSIGRLVHYLAFMLLDYIIESSAAQCSVANSHLHRLAWSISVALSMPPLL